MDSVSISSWLLSLCPIKHIITIRQISKTLDTFRYRSYFSYVLPWAFLIPFLLLFFKTSTSKVLLFSASTPIFKNAIWAIFSCQQRKPSGASKSCSDWVNFLAAIVEACMLCQVAYFRIMSTGGSSYRQGAKQNTLHSHIQSYAHTSRVGHAFMVPWLWKVSFHKLLEHSLLKWGPH